MTEIHELVIQARIVNTKPVPASNSKPVLSPQERNQLIDAVARQVLAQVRRELRADPGGRTW